MAGASRTSDSGVSFLIEHEGEVLRAYRCPAGIWTIGAGLTAASGVVKPRAGMTITRQESRRLLGLALSRNYEPRVVDAMPGAKQHEFDGGVSFDFNTGRIHNASWVKAWRTGATSEVRRRLALWNKGGGRVLAGLVRRRREEADLILQGVYKSAVAPPPTAASARLVIPLDQQDIALAREQFKKLGYDPGRVVTGFQKSMIRQFQRDHGLTIDGIIGRATLSTLRRRIDARKAPVAPVAAVATGAGAGSGSDSLNLPDLVAGLPPDLLGWGFAVFGLIWAGKTGVNYRDVIAAKIQSFAPSAAQFLRSF